MNKQEYDMATFKTKSGTELPLLNLKGKDYLQVMHRIIWFKEEKPDWNISTEALEITQDRCTVRATISSPDGKQSVTAHKMEHFKSFPDALEKSETGAIGRALALLGYGTQFAIELDEGERIVDSPVSYNSKPIQKVSIPNTSENGDPGEVIVEFGKKWKGKTFVQMGEKEIRSTLDFIENKMDPKYKGTAGTQKFVRDALNYLNVLGADKVTQSIENDRANETSGDDIPF